MSADAASARLQALAARHALVEEQIRALAVLLDRLDGDAHAPTAITSPERAVDRHIADSLAALDLGRLPPAGHIADLGSGSGLPGLAIAVALPAAHVTLVESQARRCSYLAVSARRMGLANVEVVCERAEAWEDGLRATDAVLARALAPQPVVLEYAAPLLRLGGVLVDWRGRRDPGQEQAALAAAGELGMGAPEVTAVEPFPGADEHNLHVFAKVAETPERSPRRPGMARKRPLAG